MTTITIKYIRFDSYGFHVPNDLKHNKNYYVNLSVFDGDGNLTETFVSTAITTETIYEWDNLNWVINTALTDGAFLALEVFQKVGTSNVNDNSITGVYRINNAQTALVSNTHAVYNTDDYYVLKTVNALSLVVPQNSQQIHNIPDAMLQIKYNRDYEKLIELKITNQANADYELMYPELPIFKRLYNGIKNAILNNSEFIKKIELECIRELNAKYYEELIRLEHDAPLPVDSHNVLFNQFSFTPANNSNPNRITIHYVKS
jgi:hypothetical protein